MGAGPVKRPGSWRNASCGRVSGATVMMWEYVARGAVTVFAEAEAGLQPNLGRPEGRPYDARLVLAPLPFTSALAFVWTAETATPYAHS
jgi:hypothetical protein